jgi:hypothetical protein
VKVFFALAVLFLLVIFQCAVIVHFSIFSFMPELLFMFCVYMALRFDWEEGFEWGLVCGAVSSAFSLMDIRLSLFVFGLCGMMAGSFRGYLFVEYLGTKIFVLFFVSLAGSFLFAFFTSGFSVGLIDFGFVKQFLMKIAMINILFAVPLYMFMDGFYNRLMPYAKR